MTPTLGVFRGIPRPARVPSAPPETGPGPGLTALELDGITGEAAVPARVQAETEALLHHYHTRVRQGDRRAIWELLDRNPMFLTVAWVREAFGRLVTGGLSRRGRGRPPGRYLRNPLVVVGLVRYLIDTGRAANVDRALGEIEALGLLSYETANRLYYLARREARFRPIWLRFPEQAFELTEDPAAPPAPVLGPGTAYCADLGTHPIRGPLRLTLRGESVGDSAQTRASRPSKPR